MLVGKASIDFFGVYETRYETITLGMKVRFPYQMSICDEEVDFLAQHFVLKAFIKLTVMV
jgi:hypothetical protein